MFTPMFFFCAAAVAVISYLLGSINSAIIVSRVFAGDDVRKHGSGNAGMTNMLRTYGKGLATLTALGDFFKAVIAVGLGRAIFSLVALTVPVDPGYLAALFVLLGHLFPLYFGFKGGKGVMTSLGAILMINPLAFLALAVVFVPIVFITRIVSIGSVLGAISFPFLTWGIRCLQHREPLYDTICAVIIAVIVLVMHRENIVRLLKGQERRFGGKKN